MTRLVVAAFTARRPLWFRPSAIAIGWTLGQIVHQYITTGSLAGTCGDGIRRIRC